MPVAVRLTKNSITYQPLLSNPNLLKCEGFCVVTSDNDPKSFIYLTINEQSNLSIFCTTQG